MGQHRRPVVASCCIWLLTVALVSCQNAPDVNGLRSLATEGDATAQFDLGDRYFTGEGVSQDNTEAIRWFRLAADQGHARAQASVGFMYATGEGVPQDDGEAARWYRLAADRGYAAARYSLGNMYRNARGVPQDDGEAVRWFRLAADQGHASAQYNLSGMYLNGRGVPQDDGEAARWHHLAADQGHAGAQFRLGLMYADGRGILRDDGEAARWFRLAADQGHAGGQYTLGLMYVAGRGVPKDYVAAHKWANLAAAQGHEDARELRDTLADELTECTPKELSPAAVELVRLYEDLRTFKDDPEFFQGGLYSTWIQVFPETLDQSFFGRTRFELLDEVGFHHGDLVGLGMRYASHSLSDAAWSIVEDTERRIQTGFALARCEELGTTVREMVQASAEVRRAYAAEREPVAAVAILPFSSVARMREVEQGIKQEYEAALARFAAAAGAAERGDGTWGAALAEGETTLTLATAMAAEMSAIATEMAAAEAMAPPEVVARTVPHRMEFEQVVRGMESGVVGLRNQLEQMRALAAELEQLTR